MVLDMKLKKAPTKTYARQTQSADEDANLLGFFALLYKVDARNKRESMEGIAVKAKKLHGENEKAVVKN